MPFLAHRRRCSALGNYRKKLKNAQGRKSYAKILSITNRLEYCKLQLAISCFVP